MNAQPTGIARRELLLAMMAGAAAMAGCSAGSSRVVRNDTPARELILCGADEVFILSLSGPDGLQHSKVWSWRAADCPDIPESLHKGFRTTDDCKPVDAGQSILISSSSGAVALLDRKTGRASFHAPVVNTHSIEMLPGGRIAAAASTGNAPGANRIVIFNLAGQELASDALISGHGVVWDDRRNRLWALGLDELRAYTLVGDDRQTRLKLEYKVSLPDPDGHDLSPIPGTPRLFISTGRHCWHFDRDTRQFTPHESLANAAAVKSYCVHPTTGQIAYVQAEGKEWWAPRIHLLNPAGTLHLPDQRLYKARWMHGGI